MLTLTMEKERIKMQEFGGDAQSCLNGEHRWSRNVVIPDVRFGSESQTIVGTCHCGSIAHFPDGQPKVR